LKIEVILTPAEIALLPQRDLSAATCVVFDVLRATSTLLTALANGARRVCPVFTLDEALRLKRDRLPGALLGGERGGLRIEGFDLGNSPREYTAEIVAGRDIISTTTNGTIALRACAGARQIHAGALLNLDALAEHLRAAPPERLVLVCAGSGEAFSLEDALAAGALIDRLCGDDPAAGGDAGQTVRALYEQRRDDLPAALRASSNGGRLLEIGLGADVDWCAQVSPLDWLATALPLAESGFMTLQGRPAAGPKVFP
jgi:2-phosphosulfolactate phosphatase